MNELWVNNFVAGGWSHHDWLMDIYELLLWHRPVDHVCLWLNEHWLHWLRLLHNISDWLGNGHLQNLLGLLLTLLSSFLSFCFRLLLLNDFLLMSFQVAGKVELGEEATLAVLTGESLLALVDLHVLVQVGLLGESVGALRESTFVWPLLSVDS